jgi:S-DNA-T family DNA segregation ATPase FtsK/SpoIIIE
MTEPRLIECERKALRGLMQLAARRASAEATLAGDLAERQVQTDREFKETAERITKRLTAERLAVEREAQNVRQTIAARFTAEHSTAEGEYNAAKLKLAARTTKREIAAKKEWKEARWTTTTVYEAQKKKPKERLKEAAKQIHIRMAQLQAVRQQAMAVLTEYRQQKVLVRAQWSATPYEESDEPFSELQKSIAASEAHLFDLRRLKVPKLFVGPRMVGLFALLFLLVFAPLKFAADLELGISLGIAGGVALVLGGGLAGWLFLMARKQVLGIFQLLGEALAHGEMWGQRSVDQANELCKRQRQELKDRRDQDLENAKCRFVPLIAQLQNAREEEERKLEAHFPPLLAEIKKRHDDGMRQADEKYPRLIADMKSRLESELEQIHEQHEQAATANRTWYEQAWANLVNDWQQGLQQVDSLVAEIQQESGRLFPDWSHASGNGSPSGAAVWENWQPPTTTPPVIRFGQFKLDLTKIENGVPQDERLRDVGPTSFALPALLPFPEGCSLLFKSSGAGRAHAVEALQAVMLRLLTTIPPGKVRFTIIDPIGLGQSFAAFMHLADYNEMLVSNRIWTEQGHIEQRLTDLTAHMENVIQKYLRNQFQTIEAYNEQAGEIAEPFRILVVANFPANFSEAAAKRLVSIVNSGARCGVYTLISVDTKQSLPPGFQLKDIEQHSVSLVWREGQFVWRDPDFEELSLKLDGPPAPESFTQAVQMVGHLAKDSNRVEVPFEFICPGPDDWWTGDCARELSVALGRAGATKRQHLKLGRGTSQHVLVAGKTGSGKSTLLHALILNVALQYSPDEVQMYLIDFKKGVEFKTYASHELPHAAVIAVESEREFGLSVLQRLDVELRTRGDKFREVGVQDLGGYREEARKRNGDSLPLPPLPRILLIVDEFQELFTEDDKIAQEANLLFDRLVRQGRAFGIHVLLGTQTLGGSYSLARSTVGQMAIRIALQCSEADAHLILSETNSAARLLTRPGEAIYNDANGMLEGNNPFQVVWLSDDRRDVYLDKVHALARERHFVPAQPQIVFEGNIPAEAGKNQFLHSALAASEWPETPRAVSAWLGEAIAIKDPTAAVFRRQGGSNLLMVGQHDEGALGIMATAIVSLASQLPPADPQDRVGGCRIFVIDGMPADSPNSGAFQRLGSFLPHPLTIGNFREVPAVIGEIGEELARRQAANETEAPAIFLFIYDLQRLRDLRKQDDDFGFSRGEAKPTPSKQFASILREGPSFGIHTIVWCDSLNNLNRSIDRQGIKEFEIRVLFQMSLNDSSTLMDNPAAGKLGRHRALLHSEEEGRMEKFRPYGLLTDEWLSWVRSQLNARQAARVGGA